VALPPAPPDLLSRIVASPEEAALVESHIQFVLRLVGDADLTKMFRASLAEVYVSSALFGYFLRRTSRRFALLQSSGLAPRSMTLDETRRLLQQLLERSTCFAGRTNLAEPVPPVEPFGRPQSLADYIGAIEVRDLADTMLMSQEAASVIQDYIHSLLGDFSEMMRQIQATIWRAPSPPRTTEDMRQRLVQALVDGHLASVVVSPADLRRLALEAVAFGSFLRDAEAAVELTAAEPLLTPAPFLAVKP